MRPYKCRDKIYICLNSVGHTQHWAGGQAPQPGKTGLLNAFLSVRFLYKS